MSKMSLEGIGTASAKRHLSSRLFRYILADYLLILVICLAAFLALFLISQLHDDLEDFIKVDAPGAAIIRYFVLLQPDSLMVIMPMSLLLAAMYTVARLGKHNELTAIRASGISLHAAMLPIFGVALLAAGLQFWMSESIAPQARRAALMLRDSLLNPDQPPIDHTGYLPFRNQAEARDWLIRDFQPDGVSQDIVVSQFRRDNTLAWDLRAETGTFTAKGWLFKNVRLTEYDMKGLSPSGPSKAFDEYLAEDLREKPRSMLLAYKSNTSLTQDLTINEIASILEENRAILSAGDMAVLKTDRYFRMANPFAGLVAVLLGIPLAVFRQRTATTKSFILAAGLMVLYFFTAQLSVILGHKGILPPVLCAFLPTLLFLGWGIFEMIRKR